MLRRLVVLMVVLASGLVVPAAGAEPASASTCAAVGETTVLDPTPDDLDDDCVTDTRDNCPGVSNADQIDSDADGRGDRCDGDDDNDGLADPDDNCRTVANVDQVRTKHPVYGDACLFDRDGDGVIDAEDNCRTRPNPDQRDSENDGAGDVCDADDDNDALLDERDNCPVHSNKSQADGDGDGIGDACDADFSVIAPPAPPDPVVVADRTPARVTLKLATVQRAADAEGGMAASVRCSEACSVTAELTLSKAVARRHKVGTVVAKGDAALEGAGGTYVFFDFTRAARKRLFKGSAVKATLRLRALDAAGNATSVTKRLRLAK
jgi:hypothetical protein